MEALHTSHGKKKVEVKVQALQFKPSYDMQELNVACKFTGSYQRFGCGFVTDSRLCGNRGMLNTTSSQKAEYIEPAWEDA